MSCGWWVGGFSKNWVGWWGPGKVPTGVSQQINLWAQHHAAILSTKEGLVLEPCRVLAYLEQRDKGQEHVIPDGGLGGILLGGLGPLCLERIVHDLLDYFFIHSKSDVAFGVAYFCGFPVMDLLRFTVTGIIFQSRHERVFRIWENQLLILFLESPPLEMAKSNPVVKKK